MELLRSFFRDDRPKFKVKDQYLGEVAVNVLKYQQNEQMEALKDRLFLTVPNRTTVLELKQRIFGQAGIHPSKLRLMLCGEALRNHDVLPAEVYEGYRKAGDEDEDLYRPRLCLSLQPADATLVEEEVDDGVSDVSELGSDDAMGDGEEEEDPEMARAFEEEAAKAEEERRKAEEAERKAIEERNRAAAELEQQMLAQHKSKRKVFDLQQDLERIQCGHFYEVLRDAGFHDEGSFSEIEHEHLLEKGIWIPRKARTRIVALAVSLRGRIDARLRRKSLAKDKVNANMRADGQLHGVAIEGIDEVLTNKKDINAAFKAKQAKEKEEADEAHQLKQQIADAAWRKLHPEPREHNAQLQAKIDQVRWANERDEYDVPVNVLKAAPQGFCCDKHKKEVMERRELFVKARKESNRADLHMAVQLADVAKSGFVSRDVLRIIAQEHFKKLDFPLAADDLENMLDDALLEGEDQQEMMEWTAREKYRAHNKHGFMPVAMYDCSFFVDVLAHRLEALEYNRFVVDDRDKRARYVVNDFVLPPFPPPRKFGDPPKLTPPVSASTSRAGSLPTSKLNSRRTSIAERRISAANSRRPSGVEPTMADLVAAERAAATAGSDGDGGGGGGGDVDEPPSPMVRRKRGGALIVQKRTERDAGAMEQVLSEETKSEMKELVEEERTGKKKEKPVYKQSGRAAILSKRVEGDAGVHL